MADRATLNGLLLAKQETTDGTDAVPVAATNAIQLLEPFAPAGDMTIQRMRDKAIVGSSFQGLPPTKGTGFTTSWSSKFYARATNSTTAISAANLPDIDPYLMSAGCAATLVLTGGSESNTYKPASTSLKSITEYYYIDGKVRKHFGAKSDCNFKLSAGGPLEVDVKRVGLYQQDADAAIPGSPAFGTADPPIADATITFMINSYTAGVFREFTFGTGNHIESARGSLNAATGGLATPKIRDRQIPWSILLEEDLVATFDAEGLRKNNTGFAISWTLGAVQYAKWNFTAPNARVEKATPQDSNGTQMFLLEGHLYDSTPGANDAFALKAF